MPFLSPILTQLVCDGTRRKYTIDDFNIPKNGGIDVCGTGLQSAVRVRNGTATVVVELKRVSTDT
jgi:hypothetical protein